MEWDDDEDRDKDPPRLSTEDGYSNDDSDGNGNDKNEDDGVPVEAFSEDSVGEEETLASSPVITSRGRIIRPPSILNPIMTGKSHGNSRDQGVDSPLVGKYHPDDNMESIDCQYAGAGYTTK